MNRYSNSSMCYYYIYSRYNIYFRNKEFIFFGRLIHHPKKYRLLPLFPKSTCCLPPGIRKPNVDKRNSRIKLVLCLGTRWGALMFSATSKRIFKVYVQIQGLERINMLKSLQFLTLILSRGYSWCSDCIKACGFNTSHSI